MEKKEDETEEEDERDEGRRTGGFFGSRQTKYNSASYKEGSRGDEGSLTISRSLVPAISLKKEKEKGCTLLKHEWITKSRVHSFAP